MLCEIFLVLSNLQKSIRQVNLSRSIMIQDIKLSVDEELGVAQTSSGW